MTPQPESAPLAACILFLRVPLPQQQGEWRERLAAIVRDAIAPWRSLPHLVLEAPQGFAVVANVAPSVARAAARRAFSARADWPVGIALHHGPVQATGEGTALRVAGEGLAAAAGLSPKADGSVIESEAFRVAAAAEPRQGTRRALLASAGIVALLAAGWGGRLARQRYEALHRPAVLVFEIHPSGDVFVDGEAKGSAPPLDRLSVPPGPHHIEVRHPRARALELDVQLKPGQEMVIQHAFAMPPVRRPAPPQRRKPGPLERFKFW